MARLELNLATRPFVNAHKLVVATGVLAAVLALFTFLNVYWLLGSWQQTWRLGRDLAANRAEAEAATTAAETLQKSISEAERRRIRLVSVSTRSIIEKRRLAWTQLFDQLEAVMPRDVRIISIVPDIRDDGVAMLMEATARNNEVKLKFYRKLQEQPFRDAYILGESIEADKIRFQVRCAYDPKGDAAVPIWEPMPWQLVSPTPTPSTATLAGAAGSAASAAPTPDGQRFYGPGQTPTPAPVEIDPALLGGFGPAEGGARD